jgi:UDP-N-acetylmuramate: L-alanyl-gamma-D-glutamyl-meso-diaminopimelate ligase
VQSFSSLPAADGWSARLQDDAGQVFDVLFDGELQGTVSWSLMGQHNVSNALASIAAARHVGVLPEHAIAALAEFKGVKRRMQLRGEVRGVRVYDDFAHHPTAIATTLQGLRRSVGKQRIVAILEPRSNTMRLGVHKAKLAESLAEADEVLLYQPEGLGWDLQDVSESLGSKASTYSVVSELVGYLAKTAAAGDQLLVMSNGGFGGIHDQLLQALEAKV